MTNDAPKLSIGLQQNIRSYAGEFDEPLSLTIAPAAESQLMEYWELEANETINAGRSSVSYKVTLGSETTTDDHQVPFHQAYHSSDEYGRLDLKLIPVAILEAISEITGEAIPTV
jgi:hypothetical protein